MKTDFNIEEIEKDLRRELDADIYAAIEKAVNKIQQHEKDASQPDSGRHEILGFVKRLALHCLESSDLDHMHALGAFITDRIITLNIDQVREPAMREARDELLAELRGSE
jgi:hypothetical protein